jgi:protein TonB
MNSRANTRAFSIFLAVSLAVHAVVLAVGRLSPPVTDAELPFTVEILPLQPVLSAQAPAVAPPPQPEPVQKKSPQEPVRVTPVPQRAAPPDRPQEMPPVTLATAAAPESPRSSERDAVSAPAAERRAEAAPAAIAPPPVATSDAAYLRNVLEYPLVSRRNGEQGTVLVKVLVARDGTVLKAELEKSSGSPNLDTAAVRSVSNWHFTPARRGSEAIEKEYIVPAVFRLDNARR